MGIEPRYEDDGEGDDDGFPLGETEAVRAADEEVFVKDANIIDLTKETKWSFV